MEEYEHSRGWAAGRAAGGVCDMYHIPPFNSFESGCHCREVPPCV